MAPCDVLVVDDNRELALALAILFQRVGKSVEIAYSGDSALAKICTLQPRTAVIDLTLPGMSGWDVARRARALHLRTEPLLIAMTGLDDPVFRNRSLSAGFDHHLVKPVEAPMLYALIRDPRAR